MRFQRKSGLRRSRYCSPSLNTIMKLIPLLLLLTTNASALNVDKLVDSIGQIESGMDHQAVGDRGAARGAWQLHREAWIDAGKRLKLKFPWPYAHDASIGRKYARAYAELVIEQLQRKLERDPTVQEVYAAWRLGVGGFFKRGGYAGVSKSIKASCERLANVYSQ